MKKKSLIVIIIIMLLIISGLITSYIDSARIRNSQEPKYVIKIISTDGKKVTYWGLGYKVIRYPSISPNEPYKNNIGVKYGNWFMKYEINNLDNKESTYKVTEIKNVSTNISDISNTGATIIITDTNTPPSVYGEWYKIEKEINGKWYDLKPITNNYVWITIAYTPNEQNQIKFTINWEYLYGKLPVGHYRIIKESNKQYIAIPFSITSE